jgi:hypothetical protein
MRFLLFFHDAVRPNPNPTREELFGGRNSLFLLMFLRNPKVGNPTHDLRIDKTARNGRRSGTGVWLALATIHSLRR